MFSFFLQLLLDYDVREIKQLINPGWRKTGSKLKLGKNLLAAKDASTQEVALALYAVLNTSIKLK